MKRFTNILGMASAVLLFIAFSSCQKVDGDYNAVNKSIDKYNGSIYDYLKSRPGEFDSLLAVIDRVGLADTLKNQQGITFFAVRNESFQQVVSRYNLSRKVRNKKALYLKDRTVEFLDSIVSRYIIKGEYFADDLNFNDGLKLNSVKWKYPMSGKLITGNASGLIKGGPAYIQFSSTNRSSYLKDWVNANTYAINIKANNGVVHILEPLHPFGFGDYSKAVSEPFDQSVFRGIGIEAPWQLPSEVGKTTLIEAEDFDFGGQLVASYDLPGSNGGKSYRPGEAIDIDVMTSGRGKTDAGGTYGDSYSIGWTVKSEWVNFSVYAPVDGYYTIYSRVANGDATNPLQFHWDLDLKNVSGTLSFTKGAGGWWDWQSVVSPEIYIPKGNHILRFYWDTNNVQFNNFSVKLNRLN